MVEVSAKTSGIDVSQVITGSLQRPHGLLSPTHRHIKHPIHASYLCSSNSSSLR